MATAQSALQIQNAVTGPLAGLRGFLSDFGTLPRPRTKMIFGLGVAFFVLHIVFVGALVSEGYRNPLMVGADAQAIVRAARALEMRSQPYWLETWRGLGSVQAYQYSPAYAWAMLGLIRLFGGDVPAGVFTVMLCFLAVLFAIPCWWQLAKRRGFALTLLPGLWLLAAASPMVANAMLGNIVCLLVLLAPLVGLGMSDRRIWPTAAYLAVIGLLKPPHWLFIVGPLAVLYILKGGKDRQYVLKLAGAAVLAYAGVVAGFFLAFGFEYSVSVWGSYLQAVTQTARYFPWGEILTQNHSLENWLAFLVPANWPVLSTLCKMAVLVTYGGLFVWYARRMRAEGDDPAGKPLTMVFELGLYLVLMVMLGQLYELVLAGLIFAIIFTHNQLWARRLAAASLWYVLFEVHVLVSMSVGLPTLADVFPLTLLLGFMPLSAALVLIAAARLRSERTGGIQ